MESEELAVKHLDYQPLPSMWCKSVMKFGWEALFLYGVLGGRKHCLHWG